MHNRDNVSFEFSGDASTATAVTVYRPGGVTASPASVTMTNYILVVTDVVIVNGHSAAATLELFDDVATSGTVNNGERIIGGAFAANGGVAMSFQTPHQCKKGAAPKIKASAGTSVYVTGKGYLIAC